MATKLPSRIEGSAEDPDKRLSQGSRAECPTRPTFVGRSNSARQCAQQFLIETDACLEVGDWEILVRRVRLAVGQGKAEQQACTIGMLPPSRIRATRPPKVFSKARQAA
jgi:hypothetical protein